MSERKKFAPPAIQEFAPKFAEVTDTVLFGDIWERPGLSPRDRSLVTVTALAALYRADQLSFHLGKALENGVTKDELVEAITHLAFYAGWPNAMTAMTQLKEIVEKSDRSA
ncbi:carboxymuconolactone decarboxylase family protein [Streptomyces sp. NPDC017435]|uniref:carboxymuconolactone decarboxylase family protein n=1 Tax=Streptomyces sp. NPDC017435 TaxID=3364995 RepID=UPI0037B16051